MSLWHDEARGWNDTNNGDGRSSFQGSLTLSSFRRFFDAVVFRDFSDDVQRMRQVQVGIIMMDDTYLFVLILQILPNAKVR